MSGETPSESFEDTGPPAPAADETILLLDLEGYEGPLDVLLSLARDQKVDLTKISILQLADQYLAFIEKVRRTHLELAADYLVMAAWLAYLKSRLLLPEPKVAGEEPSASEMAAALTFQLQRLEAMQEAGRKLMERPQLGIDFFARGRPEGVEVVETTVWDVTLYDLLKAYGAHKRRILVKTLEIEPFDLYAPEDAILRLEAMLGKMPDWGVLWTYLPANLKGELLKRSAVAATFVASLELVRQGKLELRQDSTFGPIYVRGRGPDENFSDSPEPANEA